MDTQTTKEAIIAEYLAGGTSFRKLSEKYGIKHQRIHCWVQAFQGRRRERIKVDHLNGQTGWTAKAKQDSSEIEKMQKELLKAQLHNKLLNAMIDIAEDQLGVPIRKKSGAKQS